jgi:signal transduction histidine kinase
MRAAERRSTVVRMPERLDLLSRDPRVQRWGDAVLALLLAVSSLVPVVAERDPSWGENVPLAIVLALASTLPVAWRARWPVLAAAIVFVANGGSAIAAAPHGAAFQPFVALVLVAYSVGSRTDTLRAVVAGPLLAVAAGAMFLVAVAAGQSQGNVLPSFVWLLAAGAVGRLVRSWRGRALELERANRELAEQRELQAEAAVAVERGRIARELHDVVAHNVSMIVVQAGAAARVLEGPQPHVREALDAIESTGRATVDEMRRLLGVLRTDGGSAALSPQPGLADLDRLVANVSDAGLPVSVRVEGSPLPLPAALDVTAYRIAQEALTNALKHAGAASAELTLRYEPAAIEIEVRDTGGEGGAGIGTGHGLVGMRERAALWGGRLEAGRTGDGWRVRAWLPVEGSA